MYREEQPRPLLEAEPLDGGEITADTGEFAVLIEDDLLDDEDDDDD